MKAGPESKRQIAWPQPRRSPLPLPTPNFPDQSAIGVKKEVQPCRINVISAGTVGAGHALAARIERDRNLSLGPTHQSLKACCSACILLGKFRPKLGLTGRRAAWSRAQGGRT